MNQPAQSKTKLTYHDYLQLPDDGKIHEIIDGDHYMSPAPETDHQTVSRWIQYQLFEQIEKQGTGHVFNAPTDVELTETDVVQPDLVIIAYTRPEGKAEAQEREHQDLRTGSIAATRTGVTRRGPVPDAHSKRVA